MTTTRIMTHTHDDIHNKTYTITQSHNYRQTHTMTQTKNIHENKR